ncbi:hypothetical protein D5085_15425 [Ectothiorhodospiraceae bacterium BW-2]|nr:hypothetical protein D5085_15425 [Ectothiorhodospiraceae bacterium BW-2]
MNRVALTAITALSLFYSTTYAGEYTIGMESLDYLPYYNKDSSQGIARDILDAFAAEHNHQFTYSAMPVKRLLNQFLAEKVDFKFPDSPDWGKDQKAGKTIVYSQGVIPYTDGIMTQPDKQTISLADFKTMGSPSGFYPWVYMDQVNTKQIKLVENPDLDGLLLQAIRGRVDGAYANLAVARYHLRQQNQQESLVHAINLPVGQGYFHFATIKHPEIITQFNTWLGSNQAKITGYIEKYGVNLN